MVKMDNKILVIASVVIVSFMLFNMDGTKKEAGETVSVSSSDPIAEAGQLELTFDLSSQAGVNLWKVINVGVPSGWTYVDKVTSGGSGNRNVLCNVDGSGVSCSMLADLGSGGVVDNQLKLLFNSPASASATTFSGDWETYSGGVLQVASSFTTPSIQFTRTCGTGICSGNQFFTTSWGSCDSSGSDAGVCAQCDSSGNIIADLSQDIDCAPTTCPTDSCGGGSCGANLFADYPSSVANTCTGVNTCTTNSCTASCVGDTDGDSYSSQCGDCNDGSTSVHPGQSEVCWSGTDENCDTISLVGSTEADVDCSQNTVWAELDSYITDWALSQPWTLPASHTITWSLLDNVITQWALGN